MVEILAYQAKSAREATFPHPLLRRGLTVNPQVLQCVHVSMTHKPELLRERIQSMSHV